MARKKQKQTTTHPSPHEEELTELLSNYLSRTEEGRQLLRDYQTDRTANATALNQFVRAKLAEDEALAGKAVSVLEGSEGQITNTITESQIDQIINVANLDDLTIHSVRNIFLFRNLNQLLVVAVLPLVILLGTVTGWYYYFVWEPPPPPPVPTPVPTLTPIPGAEESFNIVIAQFGEYTATGIESTARTQRFMRYLCNYLDIETNVGNFGMDVHVDHKNMPVIEDDAQAQKLAERLNADLVVYGNVTIRGDTGEFLPRFYVSDRTNDIEVSGYEQLSHPISFHADENSEDNLTETLQNRAAILTNYVKGLVYINVRNRNAAGAEYSFQLAVDAAEALNRDFRGKEVLYLMLAYAQKFNNKYEEARANIEKALALRPDYARAWIGLGNTYYIQYQAGDTDPALLDLAWDYYQSAMDAKDRPPNEYIEEKAMIGFGNILVYRTGSTGNWSLLDQAAERYLWIVRRHEQRPSEPGLARLAAYAHRGLGYVYDLQGNPEAAKEHYQQCLELPTDSHMHNLCADEVAKHQN